MTSSAYEPDDFIGDGDDYRLEAAECAQCGKDFYADELVAGVCQDCEISAQSLH